MGLFDSLVDVVVGVPLRTAGAVVKVTTDTVLDWDKTADEHIPDTVNYVINGTSEDEKWDGHNTTGKRKNKKRRR